MSDPIQGVVDGLAQRTGVTVMVIKADAADSIPESARTIIYERLTGEIYLPAELFEADVAQWMRAAQFAQSKVVMHEGHPYFPAKWIAATFTEEATLAQGIAKLGLEHIERSKH